MLCVFSVLHVCADACDATVAYGGCAAAYVLCARPLGSTLPVLQVSGSRGRRPEDTGHSRSSFGEAPLTVPECPLFMGSCSLPLFCTMLTQHRSYHPASPLFASSIMAVPPRRYESPESSGVFGCVVCLRSRP